MSMLLDRQTRHLILSYHFAPNAGLLNGKMGGVAFFGQYAKHTGKAYFREYAEELLDEVFDMVTKTSLSTSSTDCAVSAGASNT